LRLFKCSQWLWLVVPGLYHDNPSEISQNGHIAPEDAPISGQASPSPE
jgi:hypothetical protein